MFKDINLPPFFAGRVSWLLLMMLLLSGLIVVAYLLTGVSLGLTNHFASQSNVCVLAMPIRSGVAVFPMLFYLMMLLSNVTGLFDGIETDFEQLRRLLPQTTKPNGQYQDVSVNRTRKGMCIRARTCCRP